MKLIIGLGNPGKSYEKTRHNIGFRVLDEILSGQKLKAEFENKLLREVGFEISSEQVFLIYPNTFMNLSGEALKSFLSHHGKVELSDILVVVDEVYLPIGAMRLKPKGSAAGHHGLESIISATGTSDFPRLRIGVGRDGLGPNLTDYVLGKFEPSEEVVLKEVLPKASEACLAWALEGIKPAMNRFNPSGS